MALTEEGIVFGRDAIVQSTHDLFLDIERELENILGESSRKNSLDFSSPTNNNNDTDNIAWRRRSIRSNSVVNSDNQTTVEFETDGTISCSRLNYDVLCNITGRSNLESLKTLTLCVKSYHSSENLRLLSNYIPRLTTLYLDYSKIMSLRVLGEELPSLTTLSVCGCGLIDLDGVTFAPKLATLIAADNEITELLPVTELRYVNTIDLENNVIDDYDSISFLFLCNDLENLILMGNPISEDVDYRENIFRYLPSLKTLDVRNFPRQTKEFCRYTRKFSKDDSNNNDGSSAAGQLVPPNNETEDKPEDDDDTSKGCCHKNEKVATTKDELIKRLFEESRPDSADVTKKQLSVEHETRSLKSKPKLLERRKSLEPLKLKSTLEKQPQPDILATALVTSDGGRESVASFSSNTTFSEVTDDSGIDSSRASGSGFPLLNSRVLNLKLEMEQENMESRSTKTNKFVSLARENDGLKGTKKTEGDIEIEDFDD